MTSIICLSKKKRLLPYLRAQKEVVFPHSVKTRRVMPSSSLWTQVKGFHLFLIIITHLTKKSRVIQWGREAAKFSLAKVPQKV